MINSVIIMGRLTYDPELRTTPNGISVVRFQVACDRVRFSLFPQRLNDCC